MFDFYKFLFIDYGIKKKKVTLFVIILLKQLLVQCLRLAKNLNRK